MAKKEALYLSNLVNKIEELNSSLIMEHTPNLSKKLKKYIKYKKILSKNKK